MPSTTQDSRPNIAWLLLSLLVIVADQLTKLWLVQAVPLFGRVEVFPHLNIVHMHNTGVAFSMFNRAPAAVFVVLSAMVSIVIAGWLWRHPKGERIVAAALALILGGALGNAIDRIRLGYVVDFVDFYVGQWHFAAFNVADSAITTGAGLLLLDMLLDSRRRVSA
jgi:signal peptidase II